MREEIKTTATFPAPVEEAWKVFSDSGYIKRWWGPDKYICPAARVEFMEGGSTLVSMLAPAEYGGDTHYNLWTYTRIEPFKRIEYLQNLSDAGGNRVSPQEVNMPADFPSDVETTVTFGAEGDNETIVTIREYGDFGSMSAPAKIGLEQCMMKAVKIFEK